MNKKNKPDYTKFMKKPTPLRFSAPDQNDDAEQRKPGRVEVIPAAEILLTPEQERRLQEQAGDFPSPSSQEQIPNAEIVFSPNPPVGVSPVVAVTDRFLKPTVSAAPYEEDLDYAPPIEAPPLAALIVVVLALAAFLM